MLILLALIFGAAVGIGVHYLVPHRATRGVALAPLTQTAITAAVFTSLTWLGMAPDNPWLWAISLVLPIVVTWVFLLVLTRARLAHDDRERARLRIA